MDKVTLWHHTSQFQVDDLLDYQMWLLQDTVRMYEYMKAIEAISRSDGPRKRILDAGTGTGIWAFYAARKNPDAEVDAIDKEASMVNLARRNLKMWPSLEGRINIFQADINTFEPTEKYDLIITELDGGVGNNEGSVSAYKRLRSLLDKERGFLMPQFIRLGVCPVDIEAIVKPCPFLNRIDLSGVDYFDSYYLAYGISEASILAKETELENIDGIIVDYRIGGYQKKIDFSIAKDGNLTGFIVYFQQNLFGIAGIINHPSYPDTSWGQAYFPVRPFNVKEGDNVELLFEECMTSMGPVPHYNWTVGKNGICLGEYSNEKTQQRRR